MAATAKTYSRIYSELTAPISQKVDCGKFCAPFNEGQPVCCSTQHAVPIVSKAEWSVLKKRTEIWSKFQPYDKNTQKIVKDLPTDCRAIECKGARFCERDNRTLACRAFPFFPYIDKKNNVVGLSVYWTFDDRCWVISNLQVVEQDYIDQMLDTYEHLFAADEDEFNAYVEESAKMRRVFGRRKQPIPILARDGKVFKVMPKSGGKVVPAKLSDFKPTQPFSSNKAYRQAIEEWGGDPKGAKLPPRSKSK